MNILYLHGLDSQLSEEKRAILEAYGKVYSPAIDYRTEFNSISLLIQQYKDKDIDFIIGSSFGGCIGYYLSEALSVPSLLFNPALASRSVSLNIPEIKAPYLNYKYFVLGQRDTVVSAKDTLTFLTHRLPNHTNYLIKINERLEHQIPVDVFEKEVKHFFSTV